MYGTQEERLRLMAPPVPKQDYAEDRTRTRYRSVEMEERGRGTDRELTRGGAILKIFWNFTRFHPFLS